MKLRLRGGDPLKFRGDVLILGHHSDHRPLRGTAGSLDWLFNASLSRLWIKKEDLLDFGQVTLFSPQGKLPSASVILVGLGRESDLSGDLRRESYRIALKAAGGLVVQAVAVEGIPLQEQWDMEVVDDLARAMGEITDPVARQVDLYIPSPELLASARETFQTNAEHHSHQAQP